VQVQLNVTQIMSHRQWKEVLGWGQSHSGSGGRGTPSGVQGRSPGRGSGDEVPQKLNNLKSSCKQIVHIFGSISHIFTYICLFFPCLQASFH